MHSDASPSTFHDQENLNLDVFLYQNSEDKPEIREIYDQLVERGLNPWLDEEHSSPGRFWLEDLENRVNQIRSVAVFVGNSSSGLWQQQEISSFLTQCVKCKVSVIPVILPNADHESELPKFLENFTWVDFRKTEPVPLEQLILGITSGSKTGFGAGGIEAEGSRVRRGLKPGAPCPRLQLPENFVERPEAIASVKNLLLAENNTVVVSAIAGLGGLGKSVLATALVLDEEVRQRFADGILWVTLGQNPDLQSLLGDWIQALDKSRESYSATTLESASRYLETLLLEKQVLLVVDDAWNASHVEHFRVGGTGCRVLVTTREAQIGGAGYYSLDLMTEEEAIALVRQKLAHGWEAEQEPEVKAFAKVVGYLPLALDLAADLVQGGVSWAKLHLEFESERRSVALDLLDSPEAWEGLNEAEQRQYSLRACFNLSLRRLNREQLRRFAWLGVLPEDAIIDERMVKTLWDLPELQAKQGLIELSQRSLLTSAEATREGFLSYRLHDLMHDMARVLIEQGILEGSIQDLEFRVQNLAAAHIELLERYRQHSPWYRLVNDGYIYRHLSWHLVQAGREEELHTLLAASDELGRNA